MTPIPPVISLRKSICALRAPGPVWCFLALVWTAHAWAAPAGELAGYFGFEPARIIVVDDGCGPMLAADFNSDGLTDIAVVNNQKSRIELYFQRKAPLDDQQIDQVATVNDLRPSRWYERATIAVSQQVTAMAAHDVDGDGRVDLLTAGLPGQIVSLRQTSAGAFEPMSHRRVRGLASTRSSFAVADVTGDEAPEVIAAVGGRIEIFPLAADGALGDPTTLGEGGSDQQLVAFFPEDYNGDGLTDLLGVIPENAAPLRLWLQRPVQAPGRSNKVDKVGKYGEISAELRFESPPLREVDPVRFADRKAASIVVIERASRRIVLYDVARRLMERRETGSIAERDVQAEVRSFPGASVRGRSIVVADIDGDGSPDLLATDPSGARVALLRQQRSIGLAQAELFSAFKEPKTIAAGRWGADGSLHVFVLSEKEKTVGVSAFDAQLGSLSYPQPLTLATAGATPVAMSHITLEDGPAIAVVVRLKRKHTLEIHRPGDKSASDVATVELKGVKRAPQSIVSADIDHDGAIDLLLLTPGEPMIVVRGGESGAPSIVLTDRDMPQFGLVQAAGPRNTALLDVDGDGHAELLIADENFVRACSFDVEKGWRVMDQISVPDESTRFATLAAAQSGEHGASLLVVSDRANDRLVFLSRKKGRWNVTETLHLEGFDVSSMFAGDFTGDGAPDLLVADDASFGVIRLVGERAALEPVSTYRSDSENRLEHEIEVGDLNGDGYVDLAVLDALEQMCVVMTVSSSRKLLEATEFKVFESRLFTRGENRQFEPSEAVIADVTGDAASDLLLLTHDRVMIYPQMTAPVSHEE